MANRNSTPVPPKPVKRDWASWPQQTLPQGPPRQPSTNGNTPLRPTVIGGGGNGN